MRMVISIILVSCVLTCLAAAPDIPVKQATPVDLLLLLEKSYGMRGSIVHIRLTAIGPDDRIALMTFDRKVKMREDFTSDERKVAKQIKLLGHVGPSLRTGLSKLGGRSDRRLFSGLLEASREFRTLPIDATRTRVIVVLFGSEDFYPKPTPMEVETALKETHIRLFGVAVRRYEPTGHIYPSPRTPPTIPGPMPSTDHAPLPETTLKALSEIADSTGGETFAQKWDLSTILERARQPGP
jgi:hypothetical protein